MDVYDIASLVGHEFERVIDQHGCEAIARLMPKVVRVLEILEVLVSRHHVAPELDELRLELDRLRLERMDRIEKERKHQKELELVEDVWRGEAQDLLSQIAQLQEENKQLLTNLKAAPTVIAVLLLNTREGNPASLLAVETPRGLGLLAAQAPAAPWSPSFGHQRCPSALQTCSLFPRAFAPAAAYLECVTSSPGCLSSCGSRRTWLS
ncbi:RILP-like protein 1 [Crocuta crocuta]